MGSSTPSSNFNRLDVSPEQLASEEDQLIVALPYADLVISTLAKLQSGVDAEEIDKDEDLGLSLLRLRGCLQTEFLERIKRWFPELHDLSPDDSVGVIISSIKRAIAWYSGGWSPTMGRNRLVGHLTATDGRVISDEDPVLVENPYQNQTLQDLKARTIAAMAAGGTDGVAQEPSVGDVPVVRVGIADTPLWDHQWYGTAIERTGPYRMPAALKERASDNPFRTAHSTFVAGLVLGQAPTAKLTVSGVLDSDGVGRSWEVARALVELGKSRDENNNRINIINLSFSCYSGDAQPPLALATAIDRLDPEIVVVAGAGNYGARVDFVESYPGGSLVNMSVAPAWPAALDDVVAVGSTAGLTTKRADFSPNAAWVDILAPGDPVISTFVGQLLGAGPAGDGLSASFAKWNGTSFSTAIITGAIAAEMATGKSAREAWLEIRNNGLAANTGVDRVVKQSLVSQYILGIQ